MHIFTISGGQLIMLNIILFTRWMENDYFLYMYINLFIPFFFSHIFLFLLNIQPIAAMKNVHTNIKHHLSSLPLSFKMRLTYREN